MASSYLLRYFEEVRRQAVVVSHRGGHMVPKVRACDHGQLITQPQLCIYCAQSADVLLRGEWKVLEVHGTSEKVRWYRIQVQWTVQFREISIIVQIVYQNAHLLSKNCLGRQVFGIGMRESWGSEMYIRSLFEARKSSQLLTSFLAHKFSAHKF
jgi:hypothetical protein